MKPVPNENSIVQVDGVVPSVASYVVQQLTRTVTDMASTGITSVVIAFEQAQAEVRIVRRGVQTQYRIRLRETVCILISNAMNSADKNPELRPEIRQRLLNDLMSDLDDICEQINVELRKNNRF